MSAMDTGNSTDREAAVRELYRTRPRSRLLRGSASVLALFTLYSLLAPDIGWGELLKCDELLVT